MLPLPSRLAEPTIAILGGGNMGTALAQALACQGRSVAVWDHFPDVVDDIRRNRENRRFLPGFRLHDAIATHGSAADCVSGAALVIVCVPSAFAASVVGPVLPVLDDEAILLNVAKGFAPGTRVAMPAMLEDLARRSCVHLAGPAIANEFARGHPSFVVAASTSGDAARHVAEWLSGPIFRVGVTTDLIGATFGGILKNVYAILLGCMERLSSDSRNLEAAAVTACVHEMAEIATAHGGKRDTVLGLAGLGDLVATGFSPDSHNRKFGQALATGKPLAELETELGWLPEGARATRAACALSKEKGLATPLAEWVGRALDGTPPSLESLLQALRATPAADRI